MADSKNHNDANWSNAKLTSCAGGNWKECDPAADGRRRRWSSFSEREDWHQVWYCCVAYIHRHINPFLFQELHWGDKAAWSICLWAQPALGTSRGVLYIRLLEKYAPLHIRNIGSQEQALGIWQLTHTWKVSAIFHLLRIDPAMFKLNLRFKGSIWYILEIKCQ